ncbi:MAG: efflux RND transporter periplasmic adaptor subunit [Planctomycetes bacterium]|nr:efflux RND transporter periplasmic adaptor subunit [Planctomycetota bacterium]MBI3846498.1 efflux RND transporter periplasmic adaptor subunit [Planctomycetota bacterium]
MNGAGEMRVRERFEIGSPLSFVVLCLAPLAGGCDSGSRAASAAPAEPPRVVHVTNAIEGRLPRTIAVTGTLAADDLAVLSFKVPGRVQAIDVDLGSRVQKSQPIARLDPTDFRLRLEQAKAFVQQARARLGLGPDDGDDRVDPEKTPPVRQARATRDEARLTRDRNAALLDQKLVSQSQLDAADAALLVAESRCQDALEEVKERQALLVQRRSELEITRQQLDDTILSAPGDGSVRIRQAAVGEYVTAGSPIVTLVRVDPLRLRLPVPERHAPGVTTGQRVRFTVEGESKPHEGVVARISPSISEQNRTLLLEAEVPNSDGEMKPGAFARAEIVTGIEDTVVLVPASAVVVFAGLEKVLSVRDGRVVEKPIQTGRRSGEHVEVTEGLAVGDTVVLDPGNLVGGQPVTATP